ncbi:MAG: hypothetical protein JW999_02435 [Methanotrichaceae archaeon]|nr:hypothetical protein [Methanotrichaceae archaeon]
MKQARLHTHGQRLASTATSLQAEGKKLSDCLAATQAKAEKNLTSLPKGAITAGEKRVVGPSGIPDGMHLIILCSL